MDEIVQPELTKKQRREQRRLLRRAELSDARASRTSRRVFVWVILLAVIGGGIYLAARAGGSQPRVSAGSLADPVTDQDWIRGKRSAPVVLVEYSDLQCPACGNYYPILKRLEAEFPDRLAVVYRHFPLVGLHRNALAAARAAEAAGKQGKFWEMHDVLFEHQSDWSDLDNPRDTFTGYAGTLSLDTQAFTRALDAADVKKSVEDDIAGGNRSRVNATPTFFLNGQQIQNPRSYDEFKSIIAAAR